MPQPPDRQEEGGEEGAGASREGRAPSRRLLIGAAAAVLAAVAIVVLLIIVLTSGDDDGEQGLLEGVPQRGTVLGDPAADFTVVEYADLQCATCKDVTERLVPKLIRGPVREGEVRFEFLNWPLLDDDSVLAAAASLAAAEQGRYWQFVEAFFANQGKERSGYVNDRFLRRIATEAGVPNLARWERERAPRRWRKQLSRAEREALSVGFRGTPSFALRGPGGLTPIGIPASVAEIEQVRERVNREARSEGVASGRKLCRLLGKEGLTQVVGGGSDEEIARKFSEQIYVGDFPEQAAQGCLSYLQGSSG